MVCIIKQLITCYIIVFSLHLVRVYNIYVIYYKSEIYVCTCIPICMSYTYIYIYTHLSIYIYIISNQNP